jgi:putative membrane protein
MEVLSIILVLLIAFEHLYILVLEMFLWTKPKGLSTFSMSKVESEASKNLAMNMGLYNGFLSAGLIWGLLYPVSQIGDQIQLFFLVLVIAGVFGSFTAKKAILYIQALPAVITLIFLFLK